MNQKILIEFRGRIINELYRLQLRDHNRNHPGPIDDLMHCPNSACQRVFQLTHDWELIQAMETENV